MQRSNVASPVKMCALVLPSGVPLVAQIKASGVLLGTAVLIKLVHSRYKQISL